MKKGSQVIVNNRGKNEFGTIIKTYWRQNVKKFDIMTERQIVLEGLTTSSNFPCYIRQDFNANLDDVCLSTLPKKIKK